jgi:hypothetical protein
MNIDPNSDPLDKMTPLLTALETFLATDEDDEESRARQAAQLVEMLGTAQAELVIEMAMRGDSSKESP